jgi:hypothetical protein
VRAVVERPAAGRVAFHERGELVAGLEAPPVEGDVYTVTTQTGRELLWIQEVSLR